MYFDHTGTFKHLDVVSSLISQLLQSHMDSLTFDDVISKQTQQDRNGPGGNSIADSSLMCRTLTICMQLLDRRMSFCFMAPYGMSAGPTGVPGAY